MQQSALIHSRAVRGLQAPAVSVEVHLANGLPSFTLVGLADTEVKEARERVRAALQSCGFEFPSNKRITVNLAPADLPKDSGRFDLPIALGILAASGQLDSALLDGYEFAGELSLTGDVRPVHGGLVLALAARAQATPRALVLPQACATEAALVPRVRAHGVSHLLNLVARFMPAQDQATAVPDWPLASAPTLADAEPGPDLADVKGQLAARRALEIAAAGGHGVLLVGPPGTGKSLLAQRFSSLLPAMTLDQALESAAIASLAHRFDARRWRQRPTVSPHHTASAVALVGGGSPPRPGEISLAHNGVLFLDELPEFPRTALEALREPLETGWIRIARAAHHADFPARFQLIAAMNPCPCGWLGSVLDGRPRCRCTPERVARYQGRLSGPLLDRIDLHVELSPVPPQDLLAAQPGESSALVRGRVEAAQARALARQGDLNRRLNGAALDAHASLGATAEALLLQTASRLGWSGRALHRTLRIARTIADLAASASIEAPHLAEAVQYRRALRAAPDA